MLNPAQADIRQHDHALARLRLMFAKPEHPYYIYAPGYRETSSGIVAMHLLCHVLNLSGREAYIVGADKRNSDLKTPLYDDSVRERHRSEGKVPIAVYPEIISGNPLNLAVVSRYLLNYEGYLSGKGMEARPADLLFYYAALLAKDAAPHEVDVLCVPAIDIELFQAGVPASERSGCFLYQNRFPLDRIDYSLLPNDVRLLSIANALSLSELADVLRHAEVLYTYEWSMTCVLAALCGCPVLFIPGFGVDQAFLDNCFFGCVGFAMLDGPQPLARARETIGGALARYVERTLGFWQQLDVFVAKTQAAACREAVGNRLGVLDWLRERYPSPRQLNVIQQRLDSVVSPTIAVLVLDRGDPHALALTLDSLKRPLYERLQVFVLGGDKVESATVRWVACDPLHPVLALNDCLAACPAEWFLLVEAGAMFVASGVLMLAKAIADAPADCLAIYADEAVRGPDGVVDLALRPDLNLDLLLASPASQSRHWVYRRAAMLQHGFERSAGSAFELDAQLRLLSAHGLGSVGHVSEVLLIAQAGKQTPCTDEQSVIQRHLQARGYPDAQVFTFEYGRQGHRIEYGPVHHASVTVLIYLEGTLSQFQRCLERLLTQNLPAALQIILIDPGHDDPLLRQWLEIVGQMSVERLQVFHFMPGQPKAAMCNAAAQEASGEYLVWLSAQSAVLDEGWLQPLIDQAQRREVGAVAGKLLASDGSVRQAGLVLGLGASLGPAFEGLPAHKAACGRRTELDQNLCALSGDLLVLRRELFLAAGGFDADALIEPWADVDLCLRLHQAGYLNVFTPHARMLVDSNGRRRATVEQEDAWYERWLPLLARDPGYNRNFTLQAGRSFTLESNALSWRPLQGYVPTVLACFDQGHARAQSRLIQPFLAMREHGVLDGALTTRLPSVVELERFEPTSVVLQRPLDNASLLAMRRLRAFSQAFKVYDVDGYLPQMGLQGDFTAEEVLTRMQQGVMQADRVLVATPALAELLEGRHEDVRVLEASLPLSWKTLRSKRQTGVKPRLGWLGREDASMLGAVVAELADEVEWVVMGDCPAELRPYLAEWHSAVKPGLFPETLAALNLDLALVPMAETLANACSGDMRVLQHGACGHPVICSRVRGFVGGETLPLTRVANEPEEWLRAVRLHLSDPAASASLGDTLQATVRTQWLLEGARLDAWRQAWLAE